MRDIDSLRTLLTFLSLATDSITLTHLGYTLRIPHTKDLPLYPTTFRGKPVTTIPSRKTKSR